MRVPGNSRAGLAFSASAVGLVLMTPVVQEHSSAGPENSGCDWMGPSLLMPARGQETEKEHVLSMLRVVTLQADQSCWVLQHAPGSSSS
jgi:hypothetical protein